MVAFIVLFFPSVLSVWIWEVCSKTTPSKKSWFYLFTLNTTLVNLVCFAVKKWILLTADSVISSFTADMTPAVACNYLIMALPLAVVLALAESFIFRRVRLKLELDEDYVEAHK